ncbi:hypothetical protein [Chryseobacterium turcicum]|uniref:Peptidase S74 domain-containing protein n=1 Tax=Chryseobacterium turcicum TaxID=2898076 RepID=A0A9Q3V003_9FLAO|nr:hypothetical protein [Chryseobacterium turcicum]MCD1116349.1 hypothetical protein [Chryseobacterium turcicum]
MAKRTKSELKNYFQAGKRPTENQFGDLLDSYIHLDVSDLAYGEGGTNTINREDAGGSGEGLRSGFYQTSNPINYPAGATSWWHLLDVRHSNINNNYAMQVAGSFFDQDLWYRKTSNDATQAWRKIIAAEPNGNVGIGIENPQTKLDVNGFVTSRITDSAINSSNTSGFIVNQLGINVLEMSYTRDGQGVGVIKTPLNNHIVIGTNNTERIRVHGSTGNVGIGTQNPDQKLTVKGKIHAEDLILDMNVPADYVFQKYYDNYSSIREDYSMMTLNELEAFIKENKHLPEIPSGDKMTQDGLALGDFQMKLLQKIEELTLYAISQNNEIKQLKSHINI